MRSKAELQRLLADIYRDANLVVRQICADTPEHVLNDAINWGDLSCIEATYCCDHTGHEYYRVLIEEASPWAENLREEISSGLAELGYDYVETVTEW